jgi:hypothetical protein
MNFRSEAVRISALPCFALLLVCATSAFAQAADQTTAPAAPALLAPGERWDVVTLFEYYGKQDREPSRRERKTATVCLPAKQLTPVEVIDADLPKSLHRKCWQKDKRAEQNRAQVKYACSDGSSIEAVVRRESADVQGSQIAINIAGEGAISITRQLKRTAGVECVLPSEVPRTNQSQKPSQVSPKT